MKNDEIMACSKYELGYEDDRFEIVVSPTFHCPICLLVLKDPVMCKNEHYYCSSCIKKHLENSAFCPTCLEHLSVDTLKEASRIVKNYLSELNIRCDFYPRGCPEMVQLGDLKRHVRSCGFLPVQCSNDGCNILVNARDKLHHEAEVCDFRKLKCHDCGQLKNEVEEMKKMVARQDRMRNEMKEMIEEEMTGMKNEIKNGVKEMINNEIKGMMNEMQEMKNEIKNVKEGMKEMKDEIKNVREGMKGMFDQVLACQDKMVRQGEVKNEGRGMKVEIKEEMKEEVKEIVMNAMRDAMTGMKDLEVEMRNSNQSSQATYSSDKREKILVVGGYNSAGERILRNKTTECFNWADQTWSLLDSAVFEGRWRFCSFLYQDQMIVAGGINDHGNKTNTLKCLNVASPAATWKDFAVNLPVECQGHHVVSHNDLLFMSGGWVQPTDGGWSTRSNVVYEVQLVPPYSSKVLTRLPQARSSHGMEMFDQKLFILGGYNGKRVTTSVIQYDLVEDKCKDMPPLPYPVYEVATVLWRNNVLLIGGKNELYRALNKVVMYDVITGRSQVLPCMKQKRSSCTAVLTSNVLVVMGGENEKLEALKSVESFDLQLQVWQDLPDMIEPRACATAVVNQTTELKLRNIKHFPC